MIKKYLLMKKIKFQKMIYQNQAFKILMKIHIL